MMLKNHITIHNNDGGGGGGGGAGCGKIVYMYISNNQVNN